MTKRILLVEDDRFLRRVHEVGLRKHGFTVLTAVDGEDGLRMAQAERPALRRDSAAFRQAAIAAGMKTMAQDGLAKVLLGETTIDEVLRVAL
jgi:type II secretory ATPase GspE/PulE/Tfp pilus assembly ATPase PilB-like protein